MAEDRNQIDVYEGRIMDFDAVKKLCEDIAWYGASKGLSGENTVEELWGSAECEIFRAKFLSLLRLLLEESYQVGFGAKTQLELPHVRDRSE
jgi:hypothetical protein